MAKLISHIDVWNLSALQASQSCKEAFHHAYV